MDDASGAPPRRGPAPGAAVALELLRGLGEALVAPLRLVASLARREQVLAEVRADLATAAEPTPPPAPDPAAGAAPRVFVSCAEASGEGHAVHLVRALRARCAEVGRGEPDLLGLGGTRLADEGVRVVADPVTRAAMGFGAVLRALPFYVRVLLAAARAFRDERPDACVVVDSPALHVPLGRIARRYGVPVVHLVAPQYWGWAPWRVRGYREAVDRALTILPFEPAWFRRHGVEVAHVGHPILDELADAPDGRTDAPVLALLPGSRRSVIQRNLPWMLVACARLRLVLPDLRVVLPHGRAELEPVLREHLRAAGAESWVRLEAGDLHGALEGCGAALSVSGTVLLDLLHHRLPTVVVYRLRGWLSAALYRRLLTTPFFALPNLLVGREVCPEFGFAGEGPQVEVAAALAGMLSDPAERRERVASLDEAARRLGPPGAVGRAADWVLDLCASPGAPAPG